MRIAFWKIIVVTIVKNQTGHVMVAAENNFVSKLQSLAKKEVTFVYQKLLLFLSIAKAMAYHQTFILDIISL